MHTGQAAMHDFESDRETASSDFWTEGGSSPHSSSLSSPLDAEPFSFLMALDPASSHHHFISLAATPEDEGAVASEAAAAFDAQHYTASTTGSSAHRHQQQALQYQTMQTAMPHYGFDQHQMTQGGHFEYAPEAPEVDAHFHQPQPQQQIIFGSQHPPTGFPSGNTFAYGFPAQQQPFHQAQAQVQPIALSSTVSSGVAGLQSRSLVLKEEGSDGESDSTEKVNQLDEKKVSRQLAHNITEKKRQQSINSYIEDLRAVIPTCNEAKITKVTVLQRCLSYVIRLQQTVQELKDENLKLKSNLLQEIPSSKKISFLVSHEHDAAKPPQRIDACVGSLEALKELLQRVSGFDQTKMQILYLDPEFDNEMVQLLDLQHLPRKARIVIRHLVDDVHLPIKQPVLVSQVAEPVRTKPATSTLSNFRRDSMKVFGAAMFCWVVFSFPATLENNFAGLTSRVLLQAFPGAQDSQIDRHLIALLEHIVFIFKFFTFFCVLRIALYFIQPGLASPKLNFEHATKKRREGDQLFAEKKFEESKLCYFEALRTLGRRTDFYSSTISLLLSLTYQGLIQHTHRFRFGLWVDQEITRMRNSQEISLELAHIYHQIFKIQCFVEREKLPSLASLMLALNFAECSEDVARPFLSEIYSSMALVLFTFFPWGTTVFLGAPGGYYKTKAHELSRTADPAESRKISRSIVELEQQDVPFKPFPHVFIVMLAIAVYEYSTGQEVISILITAHVLFEIGLVVSQVLLGSDFQKTSFLH